MILPFHDAVLDSIQELFRLHVQSLSLLSLELLISAVPRELDSGEYAESVLIDLLLNTFLHYRVGNQTFPLKVHHHQKQAIEESLQTLKLFKFIDHQLLKRRELPALLFVLVRAIW